MRLSREIRDTCKRGRQLKEKGCAQWLSFRGALPEDLIDEFATRTDLGPTTGTREFLDFVSHSSTDEAIALKVFFNGDRSGHDEPRGQTLLLNAINAWVWHAMNSGRWKNQTIRSYRSHVFNTFGAVSQNVTLKIPMVSSNAVRFPEPKDGEPHHLLSTLDWPEFEGVPHPERDGLALNLIRAHGIEVFERSEKLFNLGKDLFGGSVKVSRKWIDNLDALKRLTDLEMQSWCGSKRSAFSFSWTNDFRQDIEYLADVDFWAELGVPWSSIPDASQPNYHSKIRSLVTDNIIGCVGPTLNASHAVQAIVATETGWNKSPIQRLHANPYLYRSTTKIRLGSARFIEEFKERAGHYIVGSDTNSVARGLELEALDATWDRLAADPAYNNSADYAELSSDSNMLSLMARYEKMTASIRDLGDEQTSDRYFVALSRSFKGGLTIYERDLGHRFPDGPISRPGTTFSSVKKSYVAVHLRGGGSIEEVRAAAGHLSRGVLEAHYLSDPSAVSGHIEAARFFQNCLQAMSIDDKKTAVKIGLPSDQLAWFSHLATVSGIRSACGLGRKALPSSMRPDFVFVPCRDNYIDLYLTDRALKLEKMSIGPNRWAVQGAYLHAMLKAIARTLFTKGLRSEYRAAAHEARTLLGSGQISLPVLMGV